MLKKLKELFVKETVLSIAAILAVLSAFVVLPDAKYVDYIDFRTLAILFCLMAIMAGLQRLGVFRQVACFLLGRVKNLRQLIVILVLLCFFFSMLITNDVALITFVPLTITTIRLLDAPEKERWLIPVVVMQTIAANLGSSLTPLGNPQNLYLYGISGLDMGAFLGLMLPYSGVALVLLLVWIVIYCGKRNQKLSVVVEEETQTAPVWKLVGYGLLFAVSLLTVLRIVPVTVTFAIVLVGVLLIDRETLVHIDYALLLTFVAFFVFIGNMGRIPAFCRMLQQFISGHEVMTAVVSSQVISNVPAALLLSGFTDEVRSLIIGTNLGGLGTLIASMASLISFKYIARYKKTMRMQYLIYFTAANVVFLVLLLGVYVLVK